MDLYTVFNVAPRNAESCVLIISNEVEQTRYRNNKYKNNKFNPCNDLFHSCVHYNLYNIRELYIIYIIILDYIYIYN